EGVEHDALANGGAIAVDHAAHGAAEIDIDGVVGQDRRPDDHAAAGIVDVGAARPAADVEHRAGGNDDAAGGIDRHLLTTGERDGLVTQDVLKAGGRIGRAVGNSG